MASSSKTTLAPSSARQWKYDVFLSFRGSDTRRSITSEIYDRLQNRGIKTFMDDGDLEVGDPISSTLLTAIEESKFAIVVLSPNYAASTWCLEELVKICQCIDNERIFPLFYNVNPSDVRYQKNTFEVAFDKHENSGRYKSEKLQQWRYVLYMVASFSGWSAQYFKTDKKLVDSIVDSVCARVLPIEFQPTGDFTVFEATRQAMDQVMKALKDKEVTVIGVHGMGGVGKTSLVKFVGLEARKQGLFYHVIMGTVSQAPDFTKIQRMLADGLRINLMDETEIRRASRLRSEIMRRNKILIVLDDVWDGIDLSIIGIPSNSMLQTCNSKLLLTTRRLRVCHVMMSQENISLNCLSDEDSWTLFVKHARMSIHIKDVARKVARECCGLPIALIAVARALGDKDLTDWEKAAERLTKSHTSLMDDAYACIKLTYDYLRDEDSKSCFLLCCLFPKDYDILIEDLFKYGMGIGLFRDAVTIQEGRMRAVSVVKHLKDCSLLLDSNFIGRVRMHDVIRDTAIHITQSGDEGGYLVKAGCGLKNWPRLGEGYSAISLMKNNIRNLPGELVCPKLKLLLLQENDNLAHIPDTFFENTNELRVLDLSFTSISSLSKSFIHLSNLQALYLDSCQKILDISILKFLYKLEILSMKNYPLEELSTEIGNLTNLRVLDVSGEGSVSGVVVRIPSGVILKLLKLEELCLGCEFWDWGRKVEETNNVRFDEVTSLPYLNTLKVCISDANCITEKVEVNPSWTYFDICIGRDKNTRDIIRGLHGTYSQDDPTYSRSLVLDTTISTLPGWFIDVVTTNTEELMYVNFTGLSNILMEYHHGRLDSLKYLSVIGPNVSLETLMLLEAKPSIRNKPVFEKLEELYLVGLGSLKELCSGELPSRSLQNLKLLEVLDCPNLGNVLLPSKLLKRLANLENLFCERIPGMEYVFGCEGFQQEQSKLSEMKLKELDAVKSICKGPAPPAMFQALKSLRIDRCKYLGGLFTFDVAQCLYQVEVIRIESCPNLERVIEASKESDVRKKTVLPKLTTLVLRDLPMLYSGGAAMDMECPSLQRLSVENCRHISASDFGFRFKNQIKSKEASYGHFQPSTRPESIMSTEEIIGQLVKPVGIKSHLDELVKHLHIGSADVRVIGILGVEGIGKTTAAEAVFNRYRYDFDCASFLGNVRETIKEPNGLVRLKQQLFRDILDTTDENIETVSAEVHQIIRGKKILVILDDIDDKKQLNQLATTRDLFGPGSRIVITTRNEGLLKQLDVDGTYRPQPMKGEEAIELFSWHAFQKRSPDEEYSDLSITLVACCRGLPRTIVATACFLSGKSTTEWRNILKFYQTFKGLSLYCSLFPSSYEFRKDELVQLWIAEGFVKERPEEKKLEDIGTWYFDYMENEGSFVHSRYDFKLDFDSVSLVDYNPKTLYKVNANKVSYFLSWDEYIRKLDKAPVPFLQDTVSRFANYCREEDAVFAAENTISGGGNNSRTVDMDSVQCNDYFRAADNASLIKAPSTTQHLSLTCKGIDEMTFGVVEKLKNLRTLLLLSGSGSSITHIPRKLFWSLESLRTLKLAGTLISEFPSSFRNLKNLRYLDLSYSTITRLPESITTLPYLQTLKLKGCVRLNQLPVNLSSLAKLRHLELDIIRQLESVPANMEKLTDLQTLSGFIVGKDYEFGIGQLKNLNDLRGSFCISRLENVSDVKDAKEASLNDKKGLHRLDLRWSHALSKNEGKQNEILEYLQPHSGLKELQIQCYSGSKLPTWISNSSFDNLVAITLFRCQNCKLLPSIGQLPGLKLLAIKEMNAVTEINKQFFRSGRADDQAFQKLERLEIDTMLSLKHWKKVQEGDLPSLDKLIVGSCPKFTTLPSLSNLKYLKHLELKCCPKLPPSVKLLPDSLESLMILDCPKIKEWFLSEDGEEWSRRHCRSIWLDHEEVSTKKILDVFQLLVLTFEE